MDRATAATLYELYESALAALSEAERALLDREPEPERDALLAAQGDISTAMGSRAARVGRRSRLRAPQRGPVAARSARQRRR